jgi:hypothetical protein
MDSKSSFDFMRQFNGIITNEDLNMRNTFICFFEGLLTSRIKEFSEHILYLCNALILRVSFALQLVFFILFYFILFYFILFYFILFYFIFLFILFYFLFILFYLIIITLWLPLIISHIFNF